MGSSKDPQWQYMAAADGLHCALTAGMPARLHACRAHDGWERYTSPDVLLYRGSPYSLTPPVLSLAGEVQVVVDRWAAA
jgi:hypothetical protein